MGPLITNRQCLVWLCSCSPEESTIPRQRLVHTIFTWVILAALISLFATSLAFSWKFASVDPGRSVFAIMFVLAETAVIYMALIGWISLRHKIDTMFDKLSAIYKRSKCSLFDLVIPSNNQRFCSSTQQFRSRCRLCAVFGSRK